MAKPKRQAPEPDAPRFRADENIGELLEREPRAAAVLQEFGLPCHDCVVKDFETLEQGCIPLGLRTAEVLARLNALPTSH